MIKKLLLLLFLITIGFTQDVGLGAVNLGSCTFGVAGTAPPPPITDSIGAEWYTALFPGEGPIGGGAGYPDTVPIPSDNRTSSWVVDDDGDYIDSLSAFIAAAGDDDTVYIMDDLEICMNSIPQRYFNHPKDGFILASGRGKTVADTISWGALLYWDSVGYNWPSANILYVNDTNVRITGLRIRGSYSELVQSYPTSDSFAYYPVVDENGIWVARPECEIDNCEFSGFSFRPITVSDSAYIHHCFFWKSAKQYFSYGIGVLGNASAYVEANLIDKWGSNSACGVDGGGDNSGSGYGEMDVCFNIMSRHTGGAERHHLDNECPADTFHHNTFMCLFNQWTKGITQSGTTAEDTVYIYNNWAHTFSAAQAYNIQPSKQKMENNTYGLTPPDGLSGRIPTAEITIINVADSGNAPYVCSLSAYSSTDPDGTLKEFHWEFGDSLGSDNWTRKSSGDTVIHTYDTIGVYLISLMVKDDDGCVDWDYDTVKVKPEDSNSYLTFWIDDETSENETGYWSKQAWVNKTNESWDWCVYDKDIAGSGSWEQVIVDITDTLTEWAQDSITLAFRIYCDSDTSDYWGARIYVDDVYLFGGTVVNGNFEAPADTNWTGGTEDNYYGAWLNSENTPVNSKLPTSEWNSPHSGIRAIMMGNYSSPEGDAGDYARFYQRVGLD